MTTKLKLPRVTLICMVGKKYRLESHFKALERSCEGIEFGDVKLIENERIHNIEDWNREIVYDLWRHVDTDFALLIHDDGFVVNPGLWDFEWLNYDYIGAPWPIPIDDVSYRTPNGEIVRAGNSVSLRSKKILTLPTDLNIPWRYFYGNSNEDGFLCVHNRDLLKGNGCKFAPLEVAKYFSKENEVPENEGLETFAFHSV